MKDEFNTPKPASHGGERLCCHHHKYGWDSRSLNLTCLNAKLSVNTNHHTIK